jgi:hypothetical protein
MTELQKWEAVNQCKNAKQLADLILSFADSLGMILGRDSFHDATEMSNNVMVVMRDDYADRLLTREYGIRQQAIYLRTISKY